jgi:hypothetical protein
LGATGGGRTRRILAVYAFVTGSVCLEKAGCADHMRESGAAFGRFQRMLADFPAEKLSETIRRFHDTPDRYRQLREAAGRDPLGGWNPSGRSWTSHSSGRKRPAQWRACCVPARCRSRSPTMDTKLNNVMLERKNRRSAVT